jgi:hypothetical protein
MIHNLKSALSPTTRAAGSPCSERDGVPFALWVMSLLLFGFPPISSLFVRALILAPLRTMP